MRIRLIVRNKGKTIQRNNCHLLLKIMSQKFNQKIQTKQFHTLFSKRGLAIMGNYIRKKSLQLFSLLYVSILFPFVHCNLSIYHILFGVHLQMSEVCLHIYIFLILKFLIISLPLPLIASYFSSPYPSSPLFSLNQQ